MKINKIFLVILFFAVTILAVYFIALSVIDARLISKNLPQTKQFIAQNEEGIKFILQEAQKCTIPSCSSNQLAPAIQQHIQSVDFEYGFLFVQNDALMLIKSDGEYEGYGTNNEINPDVRPMLDLIHGVKSDPIIWKNRLFYAKAGQKTRDLLVVPVTTSGVFTAILRPL